MKRAAAFDIRLDIQDQLLHRRLFVPIADDFECLHHRDAGGHHSGKLAAEHRDIFVANLATGSKQIALRLHTRRGNALTPQVRAQCRLIGGKRLSADFVPALVLAFPMKLGLFLGCGSRYRHKSILALAIYSIVTLLTSSRLVTPSFTFCNPDRRRFQTPSFAAWSPISRAPPPSMMMRPMVSVTGMT